MHDDPRLSRAADSAIGSFGSAIFVSAASAWEISTKVRLGKLPGAESLESNFEARLRIEGFTELPITVAHGRRAGFLPGSHRDPFDRMLIAQAIAEELVLVSNEKIFDDYPIRRIW